MSFVSSRPAFSACVFLLVLGLVACNVNNYGTKVSKDYLEIFYKKGISDKEADKTLELLYPLWRTEGDKTGKKSVQLTKTGDSVNFRMVTDPAQLSGITAETIGSFLKLMSDSLFSKAPVNLVLCDPQFKEMKTIRYQSTFTNEPIDVTATMGEKHMSGNVEVYAKGNVDPSKADMLAKYMDKIDEVDSPVKSYQLMSDGDGFQVKMVVDEAAASRTADDIFVQTASLLSDEVFGGKQVKLVLTDNMFNGIRQFSSTEYKP